NQFEYGSGNWKGLNGAERQKPLQDLFSQNISFTKTMNDWKILTGQLQSCCTSPIEPKSIKRALSLSSIKTFHVLKSS
ncbi:hypothetical protein Q8G50_30600, partial [Klebsiella pneumoniae]